MKMSEVPNRAFDAKPTEIPTKKVEVYDWDRLYKLVEKQGFVIIECDGDDVRTTKLGTDESSTVKAFNSWVRNNFGRCLKTKRLSVNRWFVAL